MTDDERTQQVIDEAYATLKRTNAVERDLEERRLRNLLRADNVDERARLERQRASLPQKPERSVPPLANIEAMIETKVAEAIAAERDYWHEVMAETLALEREDTATATAAYLAQLANLQNALAELREVLRNEAARSSATVLDLPSSRTYPRDLN